MKKPSREGSSGRLDYKVKDVEKPIAERQALLVEQKERDKALAIQLLPGYVELVNKSQQLHFELQMMQRGIRQLRISADPEFGIALDKFCKRIGHDEVIVGDGKFCLTCAKIDEMEVTPVTPMTTDANGGN